MHSHSTLLVFNIYAACPDRTLAHRVDLYWHPDQDVAAQDVLRMVEPWRAWLTVEPCGATVPEDLPPAGGDDRHLQAYLANSDDQVAALGVGFAARPRVANVSPLPDSEAWGFWDELAAHDFGLGGVNEWNGDDDQFAAKVLQSFSAVHCRRSYPAFMADQIASMRERLGRKLRALDIGCGPISRLRWGALQGILHIVGVDPLNDLYQAVIARHGLSALPCISPDERIAGFAETAAVGDGLFDLVFSFNALDHTQDLVASVRTLRRYLDPAGLAVVTIYTREGETQNYQGLHKYNVWLEDGVMMFNERGTQPRSLLAAAGGLQVGFVHHADERSMCLTLRPTGPG